MLRMGWALGPSVFALANSRAHLAVSLPSKGMDVGYMVVSPNKGTQCKPQYTPYYGDPKKTHNFGKHPTPISPFGGSPNFEKSRL